MRINLADETNLSITDCYAEKENVKRLEGASWDRKAKAWLVPVRVGPVLRRMYPQADYAPDAAAAIEASFRRALAFNAQGFAQMERVSPLIDDYKVRRGIL